MKPRSERKQGDISISGATYEELYDYLAAVSRTRVRRGEAVPSVAGFVDDLINKTLDDPELARAIVERLTN